jgi:hypothetical protein
MWNNSRNKKYTKINKDKSTIMISWVTNEFVWNMDVF